MRLIVCVALAVTAASASAEARQLGLNYGTGSNPDSHYVQGYERNDGTYVQGYHATNPNGYQGDNYGAQGNYNPWTGNNGLSGRY